MNLCIFFFNSFTGYNSYLKSVIFLVPAHFLSANNIFFCVDAHFKISFPLGFIFDVKKYIFPNAQQVFDIFLYTNL